MAKTSPSKGPRRTPAPKAPVAQARNKGGRPQHVPTDKSRQQVELLVGLGTPQSAIGKIIGIGETALRTHYADEIDNGTAKMIAAVGGTLFARATTSGPEWSVAAAIFILKARAGWRETSRHELTGKDGQPIQTLDLTGLSDNELTQLDWLLGKAAGVESVGVAPGSPALVSR